MLNNIQLIAVVVLVASLAAVVSSRLNQLPLVGYVFAGIVLGPAVLGVVAAEADVRFLAELGVILLLFVTGIQLSLNTFKRLYRTTFAVTLFLVLLSVALAFIPGTLSPWSTAESIVYAFAVSLSSTAVGIRLLQQLGVTHEDAGQVALSVLVAQDLLFVPMIIAINSLGASGSVSMKFIPQIAGATAAVVGLSWFLSRRVRVHLLFEKWVEKHEDLVPVAALTWCFIGAAVSQALGLSPAFGAFLSGLLIGNSYSKEKVYLKVEPLQSVLMMVFFRFYRAAYRFKGGMGFARHGFFINGWDHVR